MTRDMSTNFDQVIDDEKYRKIIPTAILTAYPRTFSDIPYSGEFFENLGFTVEFHDYTEVRGELTSPRQLGLTEEEVRDKLLAYASAVVLRLKD